MARKRTIIEVGKRGRPGGLISEAEIDSKVTAALASEPVVSLDTDQTITGLKTLTGPQPGLLLGPDIAPASLGEWTVVGAGATWTNPTVTVTSDAGSLTANIAVESGKTYIVSVTFAGPVRYLDYDITLNGTYALLAWSKTSLTVQGEATATTTGTVPLLLEFYPYNDTYVVTGISVNELIALAQPSAVMGDAEVRMSGSHFAIGTSAQQGLTTGSYNVAVGTSAQQVLTTGSNNVAIGHRAAYAPRGVSSAATKTAMRQTVIGTDSGQSSATQVDDITAVGYRATAGAVDATALGSEARADHARSVALGSDTSTTAADQVMVGSRDIEITGAAKGIVLKSPDGTRYRITVANGGTLTVTPV